MRGAVIGEGRALPGPFGPRPLVYADYVASGRSLDFIEAALCRHALPVYGNTHTETSFTGRETTRLREMARAAVKRAVGADARHAAIFAGSGATSAIDKLLRAMGLGGGDPAAPGQDRPVVFIGPYEHHSNDLPWREAAVEIERIPLCPDGRICFETLDAALRRHAGAPRRIGAFSAASNVTGIKTDLRALSSLLHRHDALFFCDFAAAGPYTPIDMGESAPSARDHIDALFLSPHKFIGGPGASGLLVCERILLEGRPPSVSGGGTVSYVTGDRHTYVTDAERREEAGTPGILGDIRAGLVLELKSTIGAERIEALEQRMVERALRAWGEEDTLRILGPGGSDRLAIFSFNIQAGEKALHHGFVTALLNDLFGIQARAGCSCAGPYAHALLGIDDERADRHAGLVAGGHSLMRPGWVRLGFNYFFDDETVDYLIEAVRFVARHGAAFLPLYRVDPRAGQWSAERQAPRPAAAARRLADLWRDPDAPEPVADAAPGFAECLAEAERLAAAGRLAAHGRLAGDGRNWRESAPDYAKAAALPREAEDLRWFWLPEEAARALARLCPPKNNEIPLAGDAKVC